MGIFKPLPPRLQRGHSLARGLIGAWEFTEGSGPGLYDAVNGHTGTLVNIPAWAGGRAGSSLKFNGSSQYVNLDTLSSTIFTDVPGFSISGWAYPTLIDGTWRTIIVKQNIGGSTYRQFFVGLNGGYSCPTNGLSFFTNTGGDGAVGTAPITTNKWYFFVAVHSGPVSGNQMYVWQEQMPLTVTSGTAFPASTQIDADDGTNPVSIGTYDRSDTSRYWGGLIDDIRIWNRALSAAEAAMLYQMTGP